MNKMLRKVLMADYYKVNTVKLFTKVTLGLSAATVVLIVASDLDCSRMKHS